ncbi:MAG: OmpA family protein [Pontixanthobacter sp.]
MPVRPSIALIVGALATASLGFVGSGMNSQSIADGLSVQAEHAIAAHGGGTVKADFTTFGGWPTRHPLLSGGEKLDEGKRVEVAEAVAAIPGVGGIRWADGTVIAERGVIPITPMHCQEDVNALLRARTIRFEESSSDMDSASNDLLDEVEAALRPCLGSIIAIVGHTDDSGIEPGNLALSKERANAVRSALIRRGIPSDGLRASGVGSSQPVEGLDVSDPANRRIEFSVIATEPLQPTAVDTPGAR